MLRQSSSAGRGIGEAFAGFVMHQRDPRIAGHHRIDQSDLRAFGLRQQRGTDNPGRYKWFRHASRAQCRSKHRRICQRTA